MRRARGPLALLAAIAGAAILPAAAAAQEEPVELTVSAPQVVAANKPIKVRVAVTAEAGALDIAAQPLRLRVALEPECGGSFAGTSGPKVIDREIPAPAPGASYSFTGRAHPKAHRPFGPKTVCAFVEDSQERQFATSTDTVVDVSKACTRATRRFARLHTAAARHRKRVACKGGARPGATASAAAEVPKIKHLFIIVVENEDEENSFGANPPAPYLGNTLPAAGAFVPNYFGIGHASLDNYLAMISGQPPNPITQADCFTYSEMVPGTLNSEGIAVGAGCVFPSAVKTVADQLEERGHTWGGYMEDMAAAGYPTCGHPPVGTGDDNIGARAGSQYATRHDPFVYFHSIIDTPACQRNVVDLGRLTGDLRKESTTPEYTFITPDLCADGHDATCADPTQPGGYEGINAFLTEWVPRIEASPGFQDRGMILVTFDESAQGAESCCGETTGPNTINNGGSVKGTGGGKVGAVMVSPCIEPGTVSDSDYNHYSMLRWVEDNFGLPHLANAAPEVGAFGSDVFSRPDCQRKMRLKVVPKRARPGAPTTFHFKLRAELPLCRKGTAIKLGGRTVKTNSRGLAKLRVKLHGHGATAMATSAICLPAKARVRVKPNG
jgi:hypothetical protein